MRSGSWSFEVRLRSFNVIRVIQGHRDYLRSFENFSIFQQLYPVSKRKDYLYTEFMHSFVKLPLNQKNLGILEVEKASESVHLLYNFWHIVGGQRGSVVNMGRNGEM